jgi:tripartite tricarboxylate transporter family receptor
MTLNLRNHGSYSRGFPEEPARLWPIAGNPAPEWLGRICLCFLGIGTQSSRRLVERKTSGSDAGAGGGFDRSSAISRRQSLPDVPAIAETVPGYEVNVWYGIIAPRNTPRDVAEKLNGALNASLADRKKIERFTKDCVTPMTTAEFRKFLAVTSDRFTVSARCPLFLR